MLRGFVMGRKNYLLETMVRDRLVVTLKDGQSFRGIFNGVDENHVCLIDAEYLKPDGSTKVDGSVFIPRDNVAFIQRP